jgi:ADP-dependent NAD(P)H-hydrate dehydratase / NAD(P)H-hydrate epimerase
MRPVVTSQEMKAIDRSAQVSEATLIERAGWCAARQAKQMMGGCYGRHVAIIAGPGNNGADGKVAGRLLRLWGAKVCVFAPDEIGTVESYDLLVDAAFGTGFHGEYKAPEVDGVPVLAVDIPSGVNGDTGEASANVMKADVTVTFAAYKPGHLLGSGPEYCGNLELCDIGLDVNATNPRIQLVERHDVVAALKNRQRESHKWKTALAVVAGSPGMMGAAMMSSAAAARSGSGMVRLLLPGVEGADLPIGEAVAESLPADDWARAALEAAERAKALVIGPGLGRDENTVACVRRVVESVELPIVIDADGLYALGTGEALNILRKRNAPTVLTPHDGEFKRLSGKDVGVDRIAAVRELALETNCTVLSKGSTTTVAQPDGRVHFSNSGSARLATAGTGDVLSGVIGAFLARGVPAMEAASFAAYVHGNAAKRGYKSGLVAGDLPELLAQELSELEA